MKFSPRHLTARQYAEQGIPVFPCVPNGKRPATDNGFHDATCDLAQIDRWWAQADFNVALSPEAAGWAILDLDGGEVGEASLAALEAEHGPIPETFEVHTPSGGAHLYFAGSLPPTVSRLGKKIDTRGVGSYVLIPPSVVDGQPYTVAVDAEIADLPEWIAPALAKTVTRQEVHYDFELDLPANVSRAVAKLNALPAVTQGDGADARAYEAAAFMHDLGLSQEKALEVMLEHFKCSPQDARYEPFLRRKIESAWTYAQNDAGAWGVIAPPAEVFSSALDKLLTTGAEGRKPRFWPYTLVELALRPPPVWLIENMLPEQSIGLLFGPTQNFKSFIALGEALTLAAAGQTVVYIAGEGSTGIEKRASAWCIAHGIERPDTFRTVEAMPWFSDPAMLEEFIAAMQDAGVKPALIVVDTVARGMVGMNENDSKDMGLFIAGMEHLKRRLNSAVLGIHHTGKDEGRGARGSGALHAGMDVVLEVKANRQSKAVELWVRKQKDAPERERPWTFEGRPFADSLVFFPTDAATHEALTKGRSGLRPEAVALKLGELGAVSEDSGVTTHVLAEQMLAPLPGETVEQREQSKGALARSLQIEAGAKLAAFAHGSPRALKWWKP